MKTEKVEIGKTDAFEMEYFKEILWVKWQKMIEDDVTSFYVMQKGK
jgi:hypothetical protein